MTVKIDPKDLFKDGVVKPSTEVAKENTTETKSTDSTKTSTKST